MSLKILLTIFSFVCFCIWFTWLDDPEDLAKLFSLYTELAHVTETVSLHGLSAAKTWVNAAEDFDHSTTLLAYETALRLFVHHLTGFPSLPQHLTVLGSLTSSLTVDAFSACFRSQSPEKAVESLEQGRGVFWSRLTRLRSPLDDVAESGPAGRSLAEKITHMTSTIRNTFNSPGSDQHDRVCRLNVEPHRVVSSIRELPGPSRFLLPSLLPDLRRAASGGPVIVINASKYSCNALFVTVNRDPVHIPPLITKDYVWGLSSKLCTSIERAKSDDVTRDLQTLLRELWDEVVSPIADFVLTAFPHQSRIWCGILSSSPSCRCSVLAGSTESCGSLRLDIYPHPDRLHSR